MSLKAAFAKVQNTGGQFYLQLAQFFEENPLIRETWNAMAQDLEQQAASLDGLPSPFWNMLKSDEKVLLDVTRECISLQTLENHEDRSLHHCYVRTLDIEEPLILRSYVPLIRLLRTEWSDHALDFYIMVKSHMARISRIIQPFSVDPVLLQRVHNLQLRFEFEVQAPVIAEVEPPRKVARIKRAGSSRPGAVQKLRKAPTASRTTKRALPLAKRAQHIVKRTKPLVHKLEISRRRARR